MPSSAPEFPIGRKLGSGAEHDVYVSADGVSALKISHRAGRWTQSMTPEAARRDLEILDRYNVPHVPTECFGDAVLVAGAARRRVDYLLRQPFTSQPEVMGYFTIDQARACVIAGLMEVRHRIFQNEKLGIDLVGFEAFQDFFRALWQRVGGFLRQIKINPRLYNLVVPHQPMERKDDEPLLSDQILLTDVRLLDFNDGSRLGKMKRIMHDIQTAAVAALLARLGCKIDPSILDSRSFAQDFGRWGTNLAMDMADRQRGAA